MLRKTHAKAQRRKEEAPDCDVNAFGFSFASLRLCVSLVFVAGLPMIHATDGPLAPALLPPAPEDLDLELLENGGVQTLGPSEMAIGLPGSGAFDATPLDALLRSLGVDTVVVGGPAASAALSTTLRAAELRGYRALLATEELAVTLGAHLTAV